MAAMPNTPVYAPIMIATAIPTTINIFRLIIIRLILPLRLQTYAIRCSEKNNFD
jgi:hypothetical protein